MTKMKSITCRKIVKAIAPYGLIVLFRWIKERRNIVPLLQLPTKVRLDASTLCQLKCCPIQKEMTIGKGYLKFEDFKNFILKNNYIKEVELANNGEIFLNPDLIHIIKYAHNNNIILTANGGTNFNTVSDEVLEALVKFHFQSITIAIDGVSQEVYSIYRVNGDFNKVIDNIKKLNAYKAKYNSKFPQLAWQFIIMENNENDIVAAKIMAQQLDMQIWFKLTWDRKYKPKNVELIRRETGLLSLTRDELLINEKKIYASNLCNQLWDAPQINYDGLLLGCCVVHKDDFGINVFKKGLEKALKSKNYNYAKKMLLGQVGILKKNKNIPCVNCSIFKRMNEHKIFLTRP